MSVTCSVCNREYEPGIEPDPCLGYLPGVTEACCGHGTGAKGYVKFENGVLWRGVRRIEHFDPQPEAGFIGDQLGFCTHCIRVRWLERIESHDSAGNPQGVCRSCAREQALELA